MTRDQLIKLETELADEVNRRAGLGGYSTDAEGILLLSRVLLQLVQHQLDVAYFSPLPGTAKK